MNEITKQQLLAIIGEEADIEVEIDQELYPKPDWAVDQTVRGNGLVENICVHGIGHPHENYLKRFNPSGELGLGIHGCDSCCIEKKEDQPTEPFQELWDDNLRKKVIKEYDERSNTPSIESGRCDKT